MMITRNLTAIFALMFGLPLALVAQNPPDAPPAPQDEFRNGIEFRHHIVIGTVDGVDITLDTAVKQGAATGAPIPAVLMIHGGGWKQGTAVEATIRTMIPQAGLGYAQNGYFVASVSYRLSGVAKWPAQIQDCKLAVRYLRANAKQLNIDPDHIGVSGFSAGAHLAGLIGTTPDVPELEGDGGYAGVSSRVQAVVLVSAPVDMTIFFTDRDGPVKGAAEKTELFGDAWKDHPEILEKASSNYYVKPGLPPFWLGTSDLDKAVPTKQVDILADALRKAEVPVEYVLVKNAGHGLVAPADAKAKGLPDQVPSRVEVTDSTIQFLNKYLKPST